jgi:hypothetical protein
MVTEMKKKKAKLREKIRNRPKTRDSSKQKKKSVTDPPKSVDLDSPMVDNPDEGLEVMSNVIWEFAQPLLKTCNDEASERKAVSLAIFVWNTALLPEKERKETLEGYLDQCREALPAEELETLSKLIDQLLEDKETRFAGNRRKITNCTFGEFGNNRHIEVGYSYEYE